MISLLDKAIEHGKEHRRPYRHAKQIDKQCRNHGICPYCKENKIFFDMKRRIVADEELKEYEEYND